MQQSEWSPENSFPGSFQEAVLKLMARDGNFMRVVQPRLPLEFFNQQEQGAEYMMAAARILYGYFEANHQPPTRMIFQTWASQSLSTTKEDWREFYKQGYDYWTWRLYDEPFVQNEVEYVRDNTFAWVRKRAEMSLLVEAKRAIDEGKDLQQINLIKKAQEIAQIGFAGNDMGIELFLDAQASWETIWTPEVREVIPVGKHTLDATMGGGVGCKELTVVGAPPNTGKTTVMADFTAGFLQHCEPVIYITCEQSALLIMQKVLSNIVRVIPEKWHEMHNPAVVWDWVQYFTSNSAPLFIKQFPAGRATVQDIESYVLAVQSRIGRRVRAVVVDYADLLRPAHAQQERRHQLQEIYTDLRAMAVDLNVACVTATQTNRESVGQERINLDKLAEDFGKAGIADIIMFLCQTELEQANNRGRIFFAKNRNRRKYTEVGFNMFYELSRLEEDERQMGPGAAQAQAEDVMNVMQRFLPQGAA